LCSSDCFPFLSYPVRNATNAPTIPPESRENVLPASAVYLPSLGYARDIDVRVQEDIPWDFLLVSKRLETVENPKDQRARELLSKAPMCVPFLRSLFYDRIAHWGVFLRCTVIESEQKVSIHHVLPKYTGLLRIVYREYDEERLEILELNHPHLQSKCMFFLDFSLDYEGFHVLHVGCGHSVHSNETISSFVASLHLKSIVFYQIQEDLVKSKQGVDLGSLV
jgi:hypothetical protein